MIEDVITAVNSILYVLNMSTSYEHCKALGLGNPRIRISITLILLASAQVLIYSPTVVHMYLRHCKNERFPYIDCRKFSVSFPMLLPLNFCCFPASKSKGIIRIPSGLELGGKTDC